MKNSWEWTEDDLLELVKLGTKENIDLDFKQSEALQQTDGKKNEISKDVSALANSAGGTLLYGIIEDKFIAKSLDKGSNPKIITKEWLEQVINSRIQRKIDGIRINQIELTKTSSGNVAYAVYVPPSQRAPHQAADKKFYKRYNFECAPLEEYEIRDISRRNETSDLRIEFNLPSGNLTFPDGDPESEPFLLGTVITNDAIEPAFYAVIDLLIDARLTIDNPQGLSVDKNIFITIADKKYEISKLSVNWNVPSKMPLFNNALFRVAEPFSLKIKTTDKWEERNYVIGYQIRAPKMDVKQGFTTLELKQIHLSLSQTYCSGAEIFQRIK